MEGKFRPWVLETVGKNSYIVGYFPQWKKRLPVHGAFSTGTLRIGRDLPTPFVSV
jgi:hypothetical protein